MDRVEAIKRLENIQSKAWTGSTVIAHDDFKAIYMALTALREQEQREQGCEYCDGTEKDLYYQDGAYSQMNDLVYISGNRIECDFGCKAWGAFEINFCPMCGRKLKEGAEHE